MKAEVRILLILSTFLLAAAPVDSAGSPHADKMVDLQAAQDIISLE